VRVLRRHARPQTGVRHLDDEVRAFSTSLARLVLQERQSERRELRGCHAFLSSRHEPINRRPFGPHADLISIIALGGYHLGKVKTIAEAVQIVHEAIDAGINFVGVPRRGERTEHGTARSLVLAHDRRYIIHVNVTAHPTAEWTAQQLRDAFPWNTGPRYLLRDRDRIFGTTFRATLDAMGI
jgi:hypothetical protein